MAHVHYIGLETTHLQTKLIKVCILKTHSVSKATNNFGIARTCYKYIYFQQNTVKYVDSKTKRTFSGAMMETIGSVCLPSDKEDLYFIESAIHVYAAIHVEVQT